MGVRRLARRALSRLDEALLRVAARSGRLSSLYCALFRPSLDRSNRAMLYGMRRYAEDVRHPRRTSTLLRRNTHRLEKGLLMRPARATFALGFIGETVRQYIACLGAGDAALVDAEEMSWARDVLTAYFARSEPSPQVDRAARMFRSHSAATGEPPHRTPYGVGPAQTSQTAFAELRALCERRKSVRWFLPRPVPREALDRAVEVALQAPSACNRQPYEFRIFDDPEAVRAAAGIPVGAAGYAHNIPVFVVVIARMRHYFDPRDRHLIYIDASLATMSFVLAAEAQGLSSCCINWPGIEEREQEMARLLGLEPDERPILCVAVGYADPTGLVAYSAPKSLDLARRYNLGCR